MRRVSYTAVLPVGVWSLSSYVPQLLSDEQAIASFKLCFPTRPTPGDQSPALAIVVEYWSSYGMYGQSIHTRASKIQVVLRLYLPGVPQDVFSSTYMPVSVCPVLCA